MFVFYLFIIFLFFFFFFFQAEDGIRDGRVTGVQTCALPISAVALPRRRAIAEARLRSRQRPGPPARVGGAARAAVRRDERHLGAGNVHLRSEERRVGKECRSRWSRYQYRKKI